MLVRMREFDELLWLKSEGLVGELKLSKMESGSLSVRS